MQSTPISVPVGDAAVTAEQEERARKTICANAVDAEEAAMLLSMLGLL